MSKEKQETGTTLGDKVFTISNGYSEWDARVAWRRLQDMNHHLMFSVFHGGTSAEDAYMITMEDLRAFYRTFYNHEIEIPPYKPLDSEPLDKFDVVAYLRLRYDGVARLFGRLFGR